MTNNGPIQFSRPYYGEEEAQAAAAAVRSFWVTGGPQLQEFERRIAALSNAKHAVGTSNWTTGAFLVLHAWGVGPGDEVIVPSLTFIATVNVIRHAGANPVFADIDPATYNVDPADIARKITPRTKVLMPVDQLGLPCDIDAVNALARDHGLKVLHDAACSFGSRNGGRPIGSIAETTVFSLHARKVVTTGEGGMIVTGDGDFAARLRMLRHQGMSLSDYQRHGAAPTVFESYPEIGYNFRITDVQAAIGNKQLDKLDEILAKRAAIARRYNEGLANHRLFSAPHVPDGVQPNWQSYQIALRPGARVTRNAAMEKLHAMGIPTRRGVMASHLEPPYAPMRAKLPHTEDIAARTLQLPMHPALTEAQQTRVLDALAAVTREAMAS